MKCQLTAKYVYVLADEMKGEMRMITTWKVTYIYMYITYLADENLKVTSREV